MKFRYLVGFAALALLASCSKQEVQDEKAWVYDETLPVPVTFSMPQAMIQSKANRIEGTSLDGKEVGVFALSKGSGAWENSRGDLVLLYNERGTVKDDESGNAGSLNFNNVVYYPMSGNQAFTFYGYYPRKTPTISEGGGLITVKYEGIGRTDILWAESAAQELDGLNGFNAAYVRNVEQNHADDAKNYLPHLEFEHKLAALNFTVVSEDPNPVEGLKLYQLCLVNAPTSATLYVANKSDNETNKYSGTLYSGSDKGDIYVYPANSQNGTLQQAVTAEEKEVGDVLVLPQKSYTVEVRLQIGNGSIQKIQQTLDDNFEPGKVYNYKVVVKSPMAVEIVQVSLKDWEDGFGNGSSEELEVGE